MPPPRGEKAFRPVMRVSLIDDNTEDGKPDSLLGVVELDLIETVVEHAWLERLVDMEKRLEGEALAAVASGSKRIEVIREILQQVKAKRRDMRERVEQWHELSWVPVRSEE